MMDRLPDELLAQTISYLARREILNLCRLSKTLALIATPLLYGCCKLTGSTTSGYCPCVTTSRLVRSLVSQPCLQTHTLRIFVGSCIGLDSSLVYDLYLDWLLRAAKKLYGYANVEDFRARLRWRTKDALTALLLVLTPNLRLLDFDMSQWDSLGSGSLVMNMVSAASGSSQFVTQRLFTHLTEVRLHIGMQVAQNAGWDFSIVDVFLRLPSLRKFNGDGCKTQCEIFGWKCGDGVSNVTELVFSNCAIDTYAICTTLRSCKALRSFECR